MTARRHVMKPVIALLFSSFAGIPSAFSLTIDSSQEWYALGQHTSFLEDAGGKLTLDQVLEPSVAQRFVASKQDTPSFGFGQSAYWFRVNLNAASQNGLPWLLEISYPLLDAIDLYLIDTETQKVVAQYNTGDSFVFEKRALDHRKFVFPLSFHQTQNWTVLIRVKSSSSLQLPLTLWQSDAFYQQDLEELLAQGMYYGLMLVMIIYNLFIWIATRHRSYAFYVGFVSSFALLQMGLHGVSYQFLWPQSPLWNNMSIGAFIGGSTLFTALFAIHILDMRQHSKRLFRLLALCAAGGFLTVLMSLVLPYRIVIRVGILFVILTCAASMISGVSLSRQGSKPALYFTLAWTSLLVGSVILVLNKIALIPRTWITENGVQIGSALEVILLSFALAYRLNTLQAAATNAEKRALGLQKRLNAELEAKLHLFSSVAHELNNPLNYVTAGLAGLEKHLKREHELIENIFEDSQDDPDAKEIHNHFLGVQELQKKSLTSVRTGAQDVAEVVTEMRGVIGLDADAGKTPLGPLIERSHKRLVDRFGKELLKNAQLSLELGDCGETILMGNPYFLSHGFFGLLSQACEAAAAAGEPGVSLSASAETGFVCLNLRSPSIDFLAPTVNSTHSKIDLAKGISISAALALLQEQEVEVISPTETNRHELTLRVREAIT